MEISSFRPPYFGLVVFYAELGYDVFIDKNDFHNIINHIKRDPIKQIEDFQRLFRRHPQLQPDLGTIEANY